MVTRKIIPRLLLVGLVLVSGCGVPEASEEGGAEGMEGGASPASTRLEVSPEAFESLTVEYASAEERTLARNLAVPAEIVADPDRRATVGPRVAGRVVEVGANIGDHVEQGAVLVVLESEEVGRAWGEWIAARARVEVAQRRAERERRLIERGITSEREVEEAEGDLRVARADLQSAETRLRTFGVPDVAEPPPDPARIALTSPITGTVTDRPVHVGQWIAPSETVMELVNLDELWLRAALYERDIRFVRPGQQVQVEVRALPGEMFPGTVARMAGSLDEATRTMGVRVVLPNPEHRLLPGMFATAHIHGAGSPESAPVLAIPRAAVQEVEGQAVVFLPTGGGAFEVRNVGTGQTGGDYVEVMSGLQPGERVVADGSFWLKGQLMRSSLGEDE